MTYKHLRAQLIFCVAFLLALGAGIMVSCGTLVQQENPAPSTENLKLAIIHTNDTHGYDMPAEPTENQPGGIGMATVAQLKKDYEADGYQVLLLDDGDATQDTPLVNYSQGASAIEFMNAAAYDAMSLGNHEFDWGVENIEMLRASATFPFISANVVVEATGESLFEPSTVITLEDGTKIGIFGLTTPETQTASAAKNVAGLDFLDGIDLYHCAQMQVDSLRNRGCSLIICLGHLGSSDEQKPNRSIDVLENTEGIDVFIDGHDHRVVDQIVGNSLLVSTGCYLENIGVILFEEGSPTEQMVAYGTYDGVDKATDELIRKTNDEVDVALEEVIGSTTVDLDGSREPGVRTQETNLGDFAADALLWQAQQASDVDVDAAIVNGGSIRNSIPAGEITTKTMMTVFPYNNSLNVVTVTGAELLEALEASTFCLPTATGGFPQVAGISYSVDTGVSYVPGAQYPNSTYFAPAKPGSRVTITDVGGKGFSLDANYVIAASSFITDGGDSYFAMTGPYIRDGFITGYSNNEALVNYLKSELGGIVGAAYAQPKGVVIIN